jgi:membrane protease YdiL (CAAX protease family)
VAVLQLLLFAVAGVIAGFAFMWLFSLGHVVDVPAVASSGWRLVVAPIAIVCGLLLATWVVGRKLLRRSWQEMGWGSPAVKQLGRGIVVGGLMATLAIGLTLLSGARLAVESNAGAYLGAALPIALWLLAAALGEELAFRGFPLGRFAAAVGPMAATLVFSLGFAVAHWGNPSIRAFGFVNIALAGVWLSVAFFTSGMPLAWGLHVGWNAMLALGFDAPVSGLVLHVPGPEYTIGRWAWLDGGAFGPEGGLVATIAIVCGIAYLMKARVRQLIETAA